LLQNLFPPKRSAINKPIVASQLGGGGEEDTEGVNIPGDDDQFSYVSAPASDYSVTTVGSEMLNNSRTSDDDDVPQPARLVKVKFKVVTVLKCRFSVN